MRHLINKYQNKNNVHFVLAHSYTVYFVLLLIGVYLDMYFSARGGPTLGEKFFSSTVAATIGIIFVMLSSILILWAQKTGSDLRKIKEIKTEHFCRGPYCYTRIPTQWGLLFLVLGFGIITNSLFIILATIISFFISKFIFVGKHERILAEKYGTPYLEYKKIVKF